MSHPTQGLRFHGGTVADAGQLDFAVNVVPGGPPGWLLAALRAGLSQATAYPDEGPATTAVAARHGRPPEEVVLLNGAAEAFWLLAQVLRPLLAVVVAPSFTEPEAGLRATGRRVQHVWRDPDSFHLDPAATLAGLARPGRVLVVDEAFMELTPGETEALAALPGLRTWPSAANFLLLQVADGPAVLAALTAHGIAVRPLPQLPRPHHQPPPGRRPRPRRQPAPHQRLAEVLQPKAAG